MASISKLDREKLNKRKIKIVLDNEILRLKEEIKYLKEIYKRHSIELYTENEIRKEKELESKIKELESMKELK